MALVPIELELYAQTPDACAAILDLLRAEGRTVTAHARFGLPQWMASLPESMGMKYRYGMRNDAKPDWRTVPRDVLVDETWHWAPLKRGPKLYNELCARAGIIYDPNYYPQGGQDRRMDIQDHHWMRLNRLVKHFTEGVDWNEFLEWYRRDHPGVSLSAGATFTRAFRTFLGGEVPEVRADKGAVFLTALSVVTGLPISPEFADAGVRALDVVPTADREAIAAAVLGKAP